MALVFNPVRDDTRAMTMIRLKAAVNTMVGIACQPGRPQLDYKHIVSSHRIICLESPSCPIWQIVQAKIEFRSHGGVVDVETFAVGIVPNLP